MMPIIAEMTSSLLSDSEFKEFTSDVRRNASRLPNIAQMLDLVKNTASSVNASQAEQRDREHYQNQHEPQKQKEAA